MSGISQVCILCCISSTIGTSLFSGTSRLKSSAYFNMKSSKLRVLQSLTYATRNSSGDEIANVNFLYDDIVHALKMQ